MALFQEMITTQFSHHYHDHGIKVYSHIIILAAVLTTTLIQCQNNDNNNRYYYVGCYTIAAADGDIELKNTGEQPSSALANHQLDDCMEYCERKHWNFAIWSALDSIRCWCSNQISSAAKKEEDALCNTDCVRALPEGGCAEIGAIIGKRSKAQRYYLTKWGLKTIPVNLHLVNASENSLTIAWNHPPPKSKQISDVIDFLTNIQVENYRIRLKKQLSFSSASLKTSTTTATTTSSNYTTILPQFIIQAAETQFEITNLHPATEYNISVESICSSSSSSSSRESLPSSNHNNNNNDENCGIAYLVATTLIGVPWPLPAQPRILEITDTTIRLQIPPIRNDNGPISKILIIVHRIDSIISQEFDSELLGSWQHAEENGLPYYIAAELPYDNHVNNQAKWEFIVGDGKQYGIYTNPPLYNTSKSTWSFSLGVVSTMNGITRIGYQNLTTATDHTITLENFTYSTFAPGTESIIALTVVCSIVGLCLILSIVSYFYLRYRSGQILAARANCHEMTMQQPIIDNNDYIIEDKLPNTDSFKEQLNLMVASLDASKKIARKQLRMNVNYIIADGIYGEVVSGVNTNPSPNGSLQDCQIHVLALDDLNSSDQAKLLREFNNICKLQQHDNIIDFFGVSATSDWFYVVFEYQTVTLKRRLIESRFNNSNGNHRLSAVSEQLILQWIYEIASAMDYLAKCKIVHKKLCSHNIYVTGEMKLKLAIFGPISYVNENRSKVDLTRWLAPEVLRYQRYSPKSDVWAFGVVAWECCTLGATPYLNYTNSSQLFEELRKGYRLPQPSFVYRDLYQMLLNCWCLEANERTNFEDVTLSVRQLMTSPLHALCFDRSSIDLPGNRSSSTDVLLPAYNPQLEMQIPSR